MDEIERLREEVRQAEVILRGARGLAEADLTAAAKNPDRAGFHHSRNADRVRVCEERLRIAKERLDAALAQNLNH